MPRNAILAEAIRAACRRRPDLVFPQWKEKADRLGGFCYIASQAFAALTGAKVLRMYHVENGECFEHYYAELDGEVWDLTAEQFDYPPRYDGYHVPRRKSKRTKALLAEAGLG